MRRLALVLLLVLAATPAAAVRPDEILPDPALEARARSISAELRCMVCQNENIDDSNAPLARDLRLLVRERLRAGDTDVEVKDFLVARFGEFVLLKPAFNLRNAALWIAPFAVVAVGGLVILSMSRRRRAAVEAAPLSAEEEARLAALLDREGK